MNIVSVCIYTVLKGSEVRNIHDKTFYKTLRLYLHVHSRKYFRSAYYYQEVKVQMSLGGIGNSPEMAQVRMIEDLLRVNNGYRRIRRYR